MDTKERFEAWRRSPTARSRYQLRRARENRTNFWRGSITLAFFTVVIGANIVIGGAVVMQTFRSHAIRAVEKNRLARITIPTLDGMFCRRMVIDNKTMRIKESGLSRCDDRKDTNSGRPQSHFSWNG
jgi:hypothetical protein